ncbi:MAG: four helix bundle protein [Planctomycetota bacterium]|jgi:four helix bundle protein
MKYGRFEDLPVWRAAMKLAERVFMLTDDKSFLRKGDLSSQLRRASVSVSNNIAEGFERGTTNELLTFLYIARGSAGEVRSMLILVERLSGFVHIKQEISDLRSLAEGVSRQLRAWADSLQNSPIKGHRYLNEQIRRHDDQSQRADAFWDKLTEEHERRIERLSSNLQSET